MTATIDSRSTFKADKTPFGSYYVDGWAIFYVSTLIAVVVMFISYLRYQEKVHRKIKRITKKITKRKKK